MNPDEPGSISQRIISSIRSFLLNPSENRIWNEPGEPAWANPLVGFAHGADPMWISLKESIGDFYWTPMEIFSLAFPEFHTKQEELTVISWVLPQTEATKEDNRKEDAFPSQRWARTRTFGEDINNSLKLHLVEYLHELGHEAVAPTLHQGFAWQNSPRFGFASNWSERHAAFVSGLGTFGLCDGLITPAGKAMRLGSVVARIQIQPTPRPYSTHNEYCMFFSRGACRKCAQRCPAGAISESGHDKNKCLEYVFGKAIPYIKENYGFDGYSCGLCQTDVPCESSIPVKLK